MGPASRGHVATLGTHEGGIMRRITWPGMVVVAVVASAVTASAASAAPSWQCTASAVSASLAGNPRIDPVASGGTPCVSDTTGLDNLPTPLGLPVSFLTAQTLSATTTATPVNGAPSEQTIGSVARIENLKLGLGLPGIPGLPTLPGLPGLPGLTAASLSVAVANSEASAVCVNGQPSLTGASQLLGASIGGNAVPLDQLATQLANALGPLAPIIDLKVNEQIRDATSLTQRALHLKLLSAAGTPLLDVIAGEARAAFDPGVCQNDDRNSNNNSGGGGGGGPSTAASANGAVLANGVRGGTCGKLSMWFVKGRSHSVKSITSRFGTRKVIRGRLVNCQGKSIVRARIDVIHIVKGKKQLVKTGLRSRAGGKLTLILPRDIKTRDLRFQYRGNLLSSRVTSRSTLHITVKSRAHRVLR